MSKTVSTRQRPADATDPTSLAPSTAPVCIPWKNLFVARENVRHAAAADDELPALAANLLANGQLQNINVIPELDRRGKPTGRYGVTAGRRRYLATGLNIRCGRWADDHPMLAKIGVADAGRMVSLSENQQLRMHAAEEFEAFAALVGEGKDLAAIAAAFGTDARHVRQRLRLANIAPALMAEFREDRITLPQLMALATVDDHQRQIAAWEGGGWNRDAAVLRRLMTEGDMASTHPLAMFVGQEAYLQAGGTVREDLFADELHHVFFDDPMLITKLAADKLEELATPIRKAEGWSWVKVMPLMTREEHVRFNTVRGTQRKLNEEEAREDAALRAALQQAEVEADRLQQAYDDCEEDTAAVLEQALQEAEDLVDVRRAARDSYLESIAVMRWPKRVHGVTGCIVTLKDGEPLVLRAVYDVANAKVVEKALAPAKSAHGGEEARDEGEEDGDAPVQSPAAPSHSGESDAMARRLAAQRTMALQALMAAQPDKALRIVVFTLAARAFSAYFAADALKLTVADREQALRLADPEQHEAAKARRETQAALAVWQSRWPSDEGEAFAFVCALSAGEVMELFALLAARGLDAMVSRDDGRRPEAFATYLNLNMHAWWEVSATNYLHAMSKHRLAEIVGEAQGIEKAKALAGLKKGEAVTQAATWLAGSGWLPPLLRS
jgi:ParB family transcriptional regulator, chromosome partitioning protein